MTPEIGHLPDHAERTLAPHKAENTRTQPPGFRWPYSGAGTREQCCLVSFASLNFTCQDYYLSGLPYIITFVYQHYLFGPILFTLTGTATT